MLEALEDDSTGVLEVRVLPAEVSRRVFGALARYAGDHPNESESRLALGACEAILAAVKNAGWERPA